VKKWEYMLADFDDRRLYMINGKEAKDYEPAKFPLFLSSIRDKAPTQGTYITEFLVRAGKNGWEAINMYGFGGSTMTILFKRELEDKKKGV
jgi:hypothetical protein